MKNLTLLILSTSLLTTCSTTPTGRHQLKLMPESQMTAMGNQSFEKMKQQQRLTQNSDYKNLVNCITDRLLKANGENPKDWKVSVFEDKSPNAFALPGNNIGVHTGMIELVENEDQLAAVIGHEIGHVHADHGNERVSQNMVQNLGLQVAAISLGQDDKTDQLLLAGLGLGLQFGVLMPFSRKHESEADQLGIKYMARAGFNPDQASELWKVMDKKSAGSPPEFLSTHPSPQSRIEALAKLAPKHEQAYLNSRNQYKTCKR